MNKMKAIVLDLDKGGKPYIEMRNMPIPEPRPDEVLVKVEYVSICGTDVSIAKYIPAMQKRISKLPHILGHEFAGHITEIGEEVGRDKWHLHDYVSGEPHIYCGKCSVCLHKDNLKHVCPELKLLGVDRHGCFAEYITVPERVLWKNSVLFDRNFALAPIMASIQEPLGNAVYCVQDGSGVKGKSVLIIGDGPAGLFATAIAKISGASKIAIIGHHDERLAIAIEVGADIVMNSTGNDNDSLGGMFCEVVPVGFDVVLEYSGNQSGIELGINLVRPNGTVMAFGLTKDKETVVPYNQIALKAINIKGIYGRKIWDTWEEVSKILETDWGAIEPIITHRFDFDDFEKGFDLMMNKKTCGKVILTL